MLQLDDLAIVLDASRALTEEIVVDALLRKLVRTLIQNAGAEWGALLAERDGDLVIEAEGSAGDADVKIDGERGAGPLADARGSEVGARLPIAIVAHVARTSEIVVLDDATLDERFGRDPCIASRRPRSVLSIPLVSGGKLIAIVYLENNRTAGAFTGDRVEVLRLLSAHAASSLQNARLHENLRRELREKNEELIRTQKQLVAQEKLASLGALTAGIAHEIENPLNFITNFASLTGTLASDLASSLEAARGQLDEGTRADVDEVLGMMQDNVAKIDEHGRRMSRIIDDMLLHSRSSANTRANADLNRMLAESMNLVRHGMRAKVPDFDIAVRAEYDPSLGWVEVVASDMSRVFINVLANACYATQEKRQSAGPGYAAEVALRTVSLGDRVEIRIRDNGTGIPSDAVDRIYHPFFTTKPPGDGTGLGLSISHDIVVDDHQGKIEVNTAPGEFTEFVITLPRAAASPAA